MGRLLRKKTAGKPKRKENGAEAVKSGSDAEGPTSNDKAASSIPATDTKRRTIAVQKASTPARAYPGRETVEKVMQFLREVRVELKRVTWPSRKQTVGSTAVVIALVMIIALFLGVVDFGLSSVARMVLQ